MEQETLENEIGNIGKWNQKDWKMKLKYWKMTLENRIGNNGKWNWKHWKMELGTLENEL